MIKFIFNHPHKIKVKKTVFLILLTSISIGAFAESKKDLKKEIEALKEQNRMLMQKLEEQDNSLLAPYPQSNQHDASPYGMAVHRTRIEELALTSTGTDIRGYGREQSAKSNFARNKAENQARQELARQIEAYARYALDQYNQETTSGGKSGLDALDRENAITAAKKVIEGARILDSQEYYDPESKIYTWEICVVYDRAGLYAVMEEQSERIKQNRDKFEQDMQTYFDEMDRMQGRMTEPDNQYSDQ